MAYFYINKSDLSVFKVAINAEDKAKVLPHIDMETHNEVGVSESDAIGFLNRTKKIDEKTSTTVTFVDWDGTSIDGNQIELTLEQVKTIAAADLKNLKDRLNSECSDIQYFLPRMWEYINYLESVDLEAISYPINDWYKYLSSIGQSHITSLQLP